MLRFVCKKLSLAATLSAFVVSGTALADNHVPQLKGKWVSAEQGGYRFGAVTYGSALKEAQSVNDNKRTWILDIETQDGTGLKGTWGSETKREIILGAIRADKKTVIFADEDSYSTGVLLSETEMDLCTQETGEAIIAQCYIMKKQ